MSLWGMLPVASLWIESYHRDPEVEVRGMWTRPTSIISPHSSTRLSGPPGVPVFLCLAPDEPDTEQTEQGLTGNVGLTLSFSGTCFSLASCSDSSRCPYPWAVKGQCLAFITLLACLGNKETGYLQGVLAELSTSPQDLVFFDSLQRPSTMLIAMLINSI